MLYFKAIIYGLVQGLAEFLPVSSSGHLVLLHKLLPLPIANNLAFDVMLHVGTLFAVLIYFKDDIFALIKRFYDSLRHLPESLSELPFILLYATIPAVVAGLLLNDYMESTFQKPVPVAIMLVVVALLFIIVENNLSQKTISEVSLKSGILIGLAQAVAIIPGVSRSGITIITGLRLGIKREVAIRFSFLLSVIVIAGASLKEVPKLFKTTLLLNEQIVIGLAFLAALTSGYWAVSFMMKFMKTSTLKPFAYYRIGLAVVILALYYLNML